MTKSVSVQRARRTSNHFHTAFSLLLIVSFLVAGAGLPAAGAATGAALVTPATPAAAGLVCESFDGYTPGSTIGSYTGWYDAGRGPAVTAGNGVAGTVGLAPATNIFNWTAHSFNWNAASFQNIVLQMDYKTDANSAFDDDRVAWTIDSASVDSAGQFGVQLDNADGGIVTYWRNSSDARVQTPIAAFPTLTANTWYRLRADIMKLTATSAKIDVSFVQLDGSGNPTGTVTTGSLADTSTWSGGAPATRYFTATSMWPSYKNHNASPGAAPADNTCYQVVSAAVGQPPNQPTPVTPVDASTVQTLSPNLTVQVSDPDSAALSVSFYGREVGAGGGADFSIIALPDTQFYSESYPGAFTAQTQWIANNRTSQNIVYVAHEGDIVNVAGTVGQWISADAAMDVLDAAGIPYGVVPGNHDDGDGGTNYNAYFGVGRFCTNYPTDCRSYYGGGYPAGRNDSNYTLFSAGGMDFIVVNLEYASPPADLLTTWADGLLKTYSSRRAIVVSHDILSVAGAFDAWGQQIYNELKDNPNLFLMLCGHNHGESRRTDPGTDGHTINSVLADYQSYPNRGNGYLRIMQFSPANNEIRFKTYSPTLNAYETDASSEFVLPYSMDGTGPFTLLGTVNGVTSGNIASWNWPNLMSGTMYEWYATVSDGASTTTGPTRSFTTAALPKAPTGLAIVDEVPTSNDAQITWTEVTEDVKSRPTTIITYQVYGSQDPYFTPADSPLGEPTATSFDHTGILPTATNWYYVVRAVNVIGASDSDPVAMKRVAKFTFGLTKGTQ
jgi:hypothetical protein